MSAAQEFPKISDYGLIGDGRTAALISRFGAIEWLCLPHFDSKSFFGAILDRERGGSFRIAPAGEFTSQQSYLGDTNILVTEFSGEGKARLTDCFSVTSETEKRTRLWPDHEIVRQLEVMDGEMEFEAEFAPRVGFTEKIRFEMRAAGVCVASSGRKVLFLQTSLPPDCWRLRRKRYSCRFRLRAGERAVFSLAYAQSAPAVVPALATVGERYALTEAYWKQWISQCTYRGKYAREVRRSALALKLLLFAPSGAIVAAPTASLPERLGGNRNWDYRYCWLRDAAFTTYALLQLGYHAEAQAFTSWMLHATRLTWPRLQVLYSVFGNAKITEKILKPVAGYRDSKPVRIGNAAHDQFQLDVYGEVLGALALVLDGAKQIDGEIKRFLIGLGQVVRQEWNEPDDGIWEVRSGKQQHTHSKLLAWLALDSLIKICEAHGWDAPVAGFAATRERIRHAIEAFGYNPEIGAYTRTLGGDELDASLLAMPLVGYCAADAPRMRSTLAVIGKYLARDDLVYRYRGTNDGVGGDEGAFGICSFWYIGCLDRAGEHDRAVALFERFLARHNGVHLWPEEIDPHSGEFLGNYPQAFSHVGLINCAVRLAKEEAA